MRNANWVGLTIFLALTKLGLIVSTANACSMPADWSGPPSNFDLVKSADTIIIGTVVKPIGAVVFDQKLLVRPTSLLKGQRLPKEILIEGTLSDQIVSIEGKLYRPSVAASDPYDLYRPHSQVFAGGCIRNIFDRDMKLVLFLEKDGNNFRWMTEPFARTAEDVPSDNALWVRAIKLYSKISQLPESEHQSALKSQLQNLRTKEWQNGNKLLADDIERQLAGCRPFADFTQGNDKCSNPKWLINISNRQYAEAGQVKLVPVYSRIDGVTKILKSWNIWIIFLLCSTMIAVFSVAKFRKK